MDEVALTIAEAPKEPLSDKIIVKRWPDSYTLMGPPIMVMDLDEASQMLAKSGWMHGWVAQKIREALSNGEMFEYTKRVLDADRAWKGRADGVVAEWRQATQKEVLDFADGKALEGMTGHSPSKRSQEKEYVLHYHEGPELIELYELLPRQAQVVLDLLEESGRETFTEASVEVILQQGAERIKTRQPVMKIFGFYRARLRNEGHIEETGDEE